MGENPDGYGGLGPRLFGPGRPCPGTARGHEAEDGPNTCRLSNIRFVRRHVGRGGQVREGAIRPDQPDERLRCVHGPLVRWLCHTHGSTERRPEPTAEAVRGNIRRGRRGCEQRDRWRPNWRGGGRRAEPTCPGW